MQSELGMKHKVGAMIMAICALALILGENPFTAFLIYGVFVVLTEFVYLACLFLANWFKTGEWTTGFINRSFLYDLFAREE